MDARTPEKRWRWRVFTNFLLFFSFPALAGTGLACYIKPGGSIAHWTGWTFLGLTRENWYGAHMAFSVLFLAAAGLHLWFNRKALAGYFRKAFRFEGTGLREGAFALFLVFAFGAGVLARIPPVAFIPRGYAYFEHEAWLGKGGASRPPWDGAEETGLRELSLVFGFTYPEFRKKLEAAGFAPRSPGESLRGLARRYGLSPAEVILRALGEKEGLNPRGLLRLLGKKESGE